MKKKQSTKLPIILTMLFSFLFITDFHTLSAENSAYDPIPLTKESEQALKQLNDYSVTFIKKELFGNKMSPLETIEMKFRKPNDVYMKWIGDTNKGQEALYRKGVNNNKVKAHKGGMLNVMNINSDPESKLVMDGQHHRIVDAGIGPTSKLVHRGMMKGIERNEAKFVNHGTVSDNGRELLKIEAIYPEKCDGATHTVAKGETLWDIAKKYDQDMYVILHNNKEVKSPTSIKEGQQLIIPYHYCHRAVTYTDSKTKLLTKLEIYDWNNKLYEFYEFKDLRINPGLTDKDFDPKNPQYKF